MSVRDAVTWWGKQTVAGKGLLAGSTFGLVGSLVFGCIAAIQEAHGFKQWLACVVGAFLNLAMMAVPACCIAGLIIAFAHRFVVFVTEQVARHRA